MLTWSHYQRWLGPLALAPFPLHKPAPLPHLLVTDSRNLAAGQWFVPLKGAQVDGHAFIGEVMSRHAAGGFFYESQQAAQIKPDLLAHGIAVSDCLAALQAIARGWRREQAQLTVLALTGSVGKTTCKELLQLIASHNAPSHAARGNLNNELGVPLTLLGLTNAHRYSVIEMGARQMGDIASLCKIAEPNVVGCLNARSAHLEIFGSRENLMATKLEILTASPQTTAAVVAADDEVLLQAARRKRADLVTFGKQRTADVCLVSEEWHRHGGMTIHLRAPGQRLLAINLAASHQAYPINVAAATALAYAAGIDLATVADALRGFNGVAGRYRVLQRGGLTVIDDTYNANPDSMQAGLASLCQAYSEHAKVVVLGDMLELGADSEYAHKKIGALCQELVKPQLLITVGSLAQAISDEAVRTGLRRQQVRHFASVSELVAKGYNFKDWGEVVYAKASRGVQLQKLVESL